MATTKTIQPTGETITIPAMADQPDMSVVATDLGNITDAVNAQNQALSKLNNAPSVTDLTTLAPFASGYANFSAAISPTGGQTYGFYEVLGNADGTRKMVVFTPINGHTYFNMYLGSSYAGWRQLALKSELSAEVLGFNGASYIDVPSGADLNTYKTPGMFRVQSGAIAQSLTHIPTAVGGNCTLIVNVNSGTYGGSCWGKQIILYGASIFMRNLNGASIEPWYRFTGEQVEERT